MPNYGVPGCANQSNTHSEKSFHRLPIISKKKKKKKKKRRGKWMEKINRKSLSKELFINSDHFKPECFQRNVLVGLDFS